MKFEFDVLNHCERAAQLSNTADDRHGRASHTASSKQSVCFP